MDVEVTPGDVAEAQLWEIRSRRALEQDPQIGDRSSPVYDRDVALVDAAIGQQLRIPYETLLRCGEIPADMTYGAWLDSQPLSELQEQLEALGDPEDLADPTDSR